MSFTNYYHYYEYLDIRGWFHKRVVVASLKGGGVNMGHQMWHEILYYVNIIMN